MAIAAVFALLCAAIVFTGCPQGNQNKGTISNTEKEKESKKEKEKDKQKDKKDNDKEDDDISKSADYAPFTGKYNKSLWEPEQNTGSDSYRYYVYAKDGKLYQAVYDTEKNQFKDLHLIGTVKNGKVIPKEGETDGKPVSVTITGKTLVEVENGNARTYHLVEDPGKKKTLQDYAGVNF